MYNTFSKTTLLIALTLQQVALAGQCCVTPTSSVETATVVTFTPTGCLITNGDGNEILSYSASGACDYTDLVSTYTTTNTVTAISASADGCVAFAEGDTVGILAQVGDCLDCSYTTTVKQITPNPGNDIVAIAYSPSGCLAIADATQTITIYSRSNTNSCDFDTPMTSQSADATVTALAFSANNCLAIGRTDGNVAIVAPGTGCAYPIATPNQIVNVPAPVTAIAFSAAGCLAIASGSEGNSQITLYQQTGTGCTFTASPPSQTIDTDNPITSISISPTSNCLAAGDSAGMLNIWTPVGGCMYNQTTHLDTNAPITSVAYSSTGCLAVANENDVTIYSAGGSLTVTVTPPFQFVCASSPSFTLTATPSGGEGPYDNYTYLWTYPDGVTTSTENPLVVSPVTVSDYGTYTVVVTDTTTGCMATGSATVQVEVLGVSLTATPSPLCLGESTIVTATVSGGVAPYMVMFTDGTTMQTTQSSSNVISSEPFTPSTASQNYAITASVRDATGCTGTATITVPVNPIPSTPVITRAVANCDATVTVSGTADVGTTIMVYYEGNPVTVPQTVPVGGLFSVTTVQPLPVGTDQITVTSTNPTTNCVSSAITTVNVIQPLSLTITGISPVCAGSSPGIQLSVSSLSGGSGSYTYQWYDPQGDAITGAIMSSLTIPNPTISDAGAYTLKVTDTDSGCSTSASYFVQVTTVGIALALQPGEICGSGLTPVTLTASIASGKPNYTVTFYANGMEIYSTITSSTTVVFNYTPAPTAANITYYATVKDDNGCTATSTLKTLVVSPVPMPTINSTFTNCDGTVTVSGTSQNGTFVAVYQGPPNLIQISSTQNVTTGNYSIKTNVPFTPAPTTSGSTYPITVIATNSFGCTGTATTTTGKVYPPLVVSITPSPANGCPGSTVTFTATVQPGTGSMGPFTYLWSGPDGFSATTPVVTVPMTGGLTDDNTGPYTVMVTDQGNNNCTATASALLQVTQAILTGPTDLCNGNQGDLTATIVGGNKNFTYKFYQNGTLIHIFSNTSNTTETVLINKAGTYLVEITDSTGCTVSSSINVSASSTNPPANLSPTVNCNGTVTITGTAAPGDVISVVCTSSSPTSTSCNGNPVAIPVTVGSGGAFSITTMPFQPGNYTFEVTATNTSCCSGTTPLSAMVGTPLTVSLSAPSVVCLGSPIVLTAMASGGNEPYSYTFTGPNGFSVTTNKSTVTVPSTVSSSAGVYTVTVTDSHNPACTATANAYVNIGQVGITLTTSQSLYCYNPQQPVILTAAITGGKPPYTVTLLPNGQTFETSQGTVTTTVTPNRTTQYIAKVVDANGCVGQSNGALINVQQPCCPCNCMQKPSWHRSQLTT